MKAAINSAAEKRGKVGKFVGTGPLIGAVLLTLMTGPSAWGAPIPLPALDQVEVNQAIGKGVRYLQTHPNRKIAGTWSPDNNYTVGYAALPGLTLLECGLPATDPQIQAAARHVRTACAQGKVDRTYEISLSILFLDRLGYPQDRDLIKALAAKLIAGQTSSGGWGYKCPDLSPAQAAQILTLLHQLNPPRSPTDPIVRDPKDPKSPGSLPGTERDPSKPGSEEITQASYPPLVGIPRPGHCIKMGDGFHQPEKSTAVMKPPPQDPVKDPPKPPPPPPKVTIPPQLAGLPVFQDMDRPPMPDPPGNHSTPGVTDNSNTQFAILALWAARRHGVAMDRSLNLVVKRFRTSQNGDGRWGYPYRIGGGAGGSPAMTCVGLLGLAIGHGIAQNADAKERAAADEMMKKGFLALHNLIGTPQQRMKNLPMDNLYFLWSVERVAVLYDMPTILEKDWYRWGAEILVANQAADGSWTSTNYPGHKAQLDTCLALLFLKRANLARDLTNRLPYNPTQLNQELIARLPTEPKPTAVTPNEHPEQESVKEPEAFIGPPSPPETESTPGIDRPAEDSKPSPSTATQTEEEPESRGFNKLLVFGIGGVVFLLAFGCVALLVMSRSSDDEEKRARRRRPSESRKPKKVARD